MGYKEGRRGVATSGPGLDWRAKRATNPSIPRSWSSAPGELPYPVGIAAALLASGREVVEEVVTIELR